MRAALILIISALVAIQATAQTPRELWNQVPRAAGDTVTSFCRTDTVKVNRYMKSMDAMLGRIDGLVMVRNAAMKSKEAAAKAEVADLVKKSPGPKISQAEAQRLNNMSEKQKKAYANDQVKQMTGMSVDDLQAMSKKMENASEEEQMAMAMQMMGGMNLSGMGEAEPFDEKKAKLLELSERLARAGSEWIQQSIKIEQTFNTQQYLDQRQAAHEAAFKKYAVLDGPEGNSDTPEIRAHHYRNFLNFMCPAVSPISLKYMNRNLAVLECHMQANDECIAIMEETVALEPTATNKMTLDNYVIGGYAIVRKYAVELKRRYEAFFDLPWIYCSPYKEDLPRDTDVYNRGFYRSNQ